MSIEEMENAWKQQQVDSPPRHRAKEWIAKARKRSLSQFALVIFVAGLAVMVLLTKLYILAMDSTRTLGNSGFDLSLGIGICVSAWFSLRRYFNDRRESAALSGNMCDCLDQLIARTQREIDSVTKDCPLVFSAFLVVFLLALGERLTAGFNNAPTTILLLVVFSGGITIAGAFLYHWLNTSLRPRLEQLESVRRELK